MASRFLQRRHIVLHSAVALMAGLPSARGQQRNVPVIGFMSSRAPAESAGVVEGFRSGLAEAGFVEGQNLQIAFRWAEGNYERLPALARELVALPVDLIFAAGGPPSALAAKAATSTIPIVFSAASDPVGLGLVPQLARPGGNITGMSTLTTPLGAKRVELLREMVPASSHMAYLVNPSNPSTPGELRDAIETAKTLGINLEVVNATTDEELEKVFAALRVDALLVAGEPFFDSRRARIVALAARRDIPASYAWRENVALGGLMSYGNNIRDLYRQSAIYAGRILKGEKPADLPVAQPTKFELVVNVKTAKTLGITIPPALLARADEVIE